MVPWSLFYGSFFALYGVWVTFGPARLLQLAPRWAALSLALSTLVYFVALPAAQWVWQRLGFSRALALWGGLATLAYGLPALQPALLPLALPVGSLAAAGTYGIAETFMIETLTAQGRAHLFGPVRKWGSLGFLLAAACGGLLLDRLGGVQAMERLLGVTALAFGASCALLVRHQRIEPLDLAMPARLHGGDAGELEPVTAAAEALAETLPSAADSTAAPAPAPLWLAGLGLAAISLHRMAENQSTAWLGAMWIARGHPTSEAGILAAWAVAAEFLAMGASARFLADFKLARLMLICTGISVLRWWLTPVCQQFACVAALQTLHALSFGVFYPASLLWLRKQRPDDFFAARYLMEGSSRALAGGYYFLAAGTLIPLFGYGAVFRGCALIAAGAAALWLILLLLHRERR